MKPITSHFFCYVVSASQIYVSILYERRNQVWSLFLFMLSLVSAGQSLFFFAFWREEKRQHSS